MKTFKEMYETCAAAGNKAYNEKASANPWSSADDAGEASDVAFTKKAKELLPFWKLRKYVTEKEFLFELEKHKQD